MSRVPVTLEGPQSRWMAWAERGLPQSIVLSIKEGISLNLKCSIEELPQRRTIPPNGIGAERLEQVWVDMEVERLMAIGALKEMKPRWISPVRTAPKPGLKLFRLVVNCRALNKFVAYEQGRFEDLSSILSKLKRDYYFVSVDQIDAYLAMRVHEKYVPLLGISIAGRQYCYQALPFGLTSSPGHYTTIMGAVIDFWRQRRGFQVSAFYDDVTLIHRHEETLQQQTETLRWDAREMGVYFDDKKGNPNPTQIGVLLGLRVDTRRMELSIPSEKVLRLQSKARSLLESSAPTARQIYSMASSLLSYRRACALAAIRAYPLFRTGRGKTAWDEPVVLTTEAREALSWVVENLERCNGRRFGWEPEEIYDVEIDASSSGWGAHLVEPQTRRTLLRARGHWRAKDSAEVSNVRETRVPAMALESLRQHLTPGRAVRFHTDNTTCLAYLRRGAGPLRHLSDIAHHATELAASMQLDLLPPRFLAGINNTQADASSRSIDLDGWALRPEVFNTVDLHFGPLTIDRFATDTNAKLERFNSSDLCPGAEAIDCFAQDWSRDNNYFFPPVALIGRVLEKVMAEGARGVLIVPERRDLPWWEQAERVARDRRPLSLRAFEDVTDESIEQMRRIANQWWALQIDGRRAR